MKGSAAGFAPLSGHRVRMAGPPAAPGRTVHPLRHVLSAAALAAVIVAGLSACTERINASALHATGAPSTAAEVAAAPAGETSPSSAPTAQAARQPTAAPITTARPTRPARRQAPTPTGRPRSPATAPTPPANTSTAGQVLALVNAERAKVGCAPLTLDARLTAAAAGHSRDMAATDLFSHDSRDGRSFADRIRAAGYPTPRAENIAAGQRTPAAVMAAWMNSPGHRRNILDCTATDIGVASANGGTFGIYWTQDFGAG